MNSPASWVISREKSHPSTPSNERTLCITANFDRQSPGWGHFEPEIPGAATHLRGRAAAKPDAISIPPGRAVNCAATQSPRLAFAAANLVRFAVIFRQHAWREQADRLFDGILSRAGDNLFAHLALLNALDLRLRAAEIAVTGNDARADELLAAARAFPFLDRVVMRACDMLPASHPAQEKIKAAKGSAAFICVGERCSLPVTEAAALAGQSVRCGCESLKSSSCAGLTRASILFSRESRKNRWIAGLYQPSLTLTLSAVIAGLDPQVGFTRLAALLMCGPRASPRSDAIHHFDE
jgi:hypothetical protein